MTINDQIRKLEEENFKTKPLNRPVYINPFLLKSDSQILTDIYNKKTTPPIMTAPKLQPEGETTRPSTRSGRTTPPRFSAKDDKDKQMQPQPPPQHHQVGEQHHQVGEVEEMDQPLHRVG